MAFFATYIKYLTRLYCKTVTHRHPQRRRAEFQPHICCSCRELPLFSVPSRVVPFGRQCYGYLIPALQVRGTYVSQKISTLRRGRWYFPRKTSIAVLVSLVELPKQNDNGNRLDAKKASPAVHTYRSKAGSLLSPTRRNRNIIKTKPK